MTIAFDVHSNFDTLKHRSICLCSRYPIAEMMRSKHSPSATPIVSPYVLFALLANREMFRYIMHFHRADSCRCLPTYARCIIVNKPSGNPLRPAAFLFSSLSLPLFRLLSLSLFTSLSYLLNPSLARLDSPSLSHSTPSSVLLHLAIHVTGTVYWFLEGSACALVHAISAVKGFVHDGGDEVGGSPDRGDTDEGTSESGTVGGRRMIWEGEGEKERNIGIEIERIVGNGFMYFYGNGILLW